MMDHICDRSRRGKMVCLPGVNIVCFVVIGNMLEYAHVNVDYGFF